MTRPTGTLKVLFLFLSILLLNFCVMRQTLYLFTELLEPECQTYTNYSRQRQSRSKSFISECLCVCVCVCVRTIEPKWLTLITKLAAGIVRHESGYPFNIRWGDLSQKVKVTGSQSMKRGDRVASVSLHSMEWPASTWQLKCLCLYVGSQKWYVFVKL